jgi:hypothetical protein
LEHLAPSFVMRKKKLLHHCFIERTSVESGSCLRKNQSAFRFKRQVEASPM